MESFRVQLGAGVQRFLDLGSSFLGFGLEAQDLGFRVLGLGVTGSGRDASFICGRLTRNGRKF